MQKNPLVSLVKRKKIIDNKNSCTCISLWHFLIHGNWFAFSIVREKIINTKRQTIHPEKDML